MEFKVITLNCWGIPVVSKNRRERMQAIAEYLATSQYDVVCLQEIWATKDFNLIRDKVSGVLPYAHYFYSGVVGSGVCILSRHPFQDVFFHQWSVNGYVHKIQHGDWFGGKGVGLCQLKINGFRINVYSAHLHAEYNRENDEYQAHRVLQAYDTAQFIQLTSSAADLVVLAGDLNTEPGDLAYRILLTMTDFKDSYVEATTEGSENVCQASTNESLDNSYTAKALIKKQIEGKRIDYIMYTAGGQVEAKLLKYCQPLPKKVPQYSFSYSDHEAISILLKISKTQGGPMKKDQEKKFKVLNECMDIFNDALKRLRYHKQIYWFLSALLLVVLLGSSAMDPPYGTFIVIHVLRVVLSIIFTFTVIMASLWNKIECNAVTAGKLAVDVNLRQMIVKEQF